MISLIVPKSTSMYSGVVSSKNGEGDSNSDILVFTDHKIIDFNCT